VKREEVKINEAKPEEVKPEPKPDEPPPEMKPLGLDAEGGAGSDGFGLAANKGGRDITTLGPGSGTGTGTGGGSKFGWYAGLIQTHLQESIARNKRLREEEFRVVVNVWLRPDGSVQRTELVGSTGRAETDELIRLAFGEVAPVREPPPSDLPQPVRLRITNRL
jgi:protein TonB